MHLNCLKLAERRKDIYSFAMVIVEFSLPERSHPWEGELSSIDLIFQHVKNGKKPAITSKNLENLPKNKQDLWVSLIQNCWSQKPESQPSMNDVYKHLSLLSPADQNVNSIGTAEKMSTDELTPKIDIDDVNLDVHRGTVAEIAGDIAVWACENNEEIINVQHDLENCIDRLDGTNACPFLTIKNVDMLYSEPTVVLNKKELKQKVENILQHLPSQINDSRDATKYSNIEEAMEVLNCKTFTDA